MSRRMMLVAPALAALTLTLTPPAAPAKELEQALVCGASGCTDVTDRVPHDESMLQTSVIDPGPSKRESFYRIRFGLGDGHSARAQGSWRVLYVPSQGIVGSVDGSTGQRIWSRMTPDGQAAFRRAVRGIAPLPAKRLPLPRPGGERPDGALPPEVIAPPVPVARRSEGLDAWPAVALLIPAGGALALLAGRRVRHHRDGSDAAPPGSTE
jgi:hypothetical protein